MRDESLRELERAALERPDDAVARIRWVRALQRAGHEVEALASLDLSRVPDDRYAEARALADELWLARLARLEPAARVPGEHAVAQLVLEPAGTFLAWSVANRPLVTVADATTGELATDGVRTASEVHHLLPAPGEVIAVGWSGAPCTRIVRERDGGVTSTRIEQPGIEAVAPDGRGVIVRAGDGVIALDWPSLEPRGRSRRIGGLTRGVDWRRGRVLTWSVSDFAAAFVSLATGERTVVFEGLPADSLETAVDHLGGDLVAYRARGLTVARTSAWTLPLVASRAPTRPSLSSDGRELRVELALRPVRFFLDLERGVVAGAPPEVERLARDHDRAGGAIWHPHAGVAYVRRRDGRFELRAVERDEPLLTFPPEVQPWCWSPDGHALVVLRAARGPRVSIEVWRAR